MGESPARALRQENTCVLVTEAQYGWSIINKEEACHEVVGRIRGSVVECDYFPTIIRKLLKD